MTNIIKASILRGLGTRVGSGGSAFAPFTLTAHEWWRFKAAGCAGNTNWEMGEIEIAASAGGVDQCTGGTASASSNSASAGNAFDNSLSTGWGSTFSLNSWIVYHFTAPVVAGEVRLTRQASGASSTPIGLELEYSDDGTNWFHFCSFVDTTWTNSQTRTWTFSTSLANSSTTWRNVTFLNTNSSNGHIDIAEAAFASSAGGSNLATGGTPSYNGIDGGTYPATAAFDGNTATWGRWTNTNRCWLLYTFPSAVGIKEMRITGQTVGGTGNPQDLKLQLPDGSGIWRTVAQVGGYSAWSNSETKTVSVS